jgi:hypothetical protein
MNEYSPLNFFGFLILESFLMSDISFIEFWSRESPPIVLNYDVFANFELILTPNFSAYSILRLCLKANLFLYIYLSLWMIFCFISSFFFESNIAFSKLSQEFLSIVNTLFVTMLST